MFELFKQKLHTVRHSHLHQHTAQNPHFGQGGLVNQQFFLTGAGAGNINRREEAFIGQFSIKNDLRVAGSIEFFKDNFVHAGTGINQSRGDNGQRSAFFNIAGCTENAFRPLESICIDTAGQNLAGRREYRSVSATTSFLFSTRRLAFSITISAT